MSLPFAASWAQALGALDPVPADKLSVLLRASGSDAASQCTGTFCVVRALWLAGLARAGARYRWRAQLSADRAVGLRSSLN